MNKRCFAYQEPKQPHTRLPGQGAALASLTAALLAGCGGEPADAAQVDAPTVADALEFDSAPRQFTVTTRYNEPIPGRARLVVFREPTGDWQLATEIDVGRYAGTVDGGLLDIAVVCENGEYDDVSVQFIHLTSADILDVESPCAAVNPRVTVTGEVRPAGSRLYLPRVYMPSASTFDVDVTAGIGDGVAISSSAVLLVHDVVFSSSTTLLLDIDANGSPFSDPNMTVTGAGQEPVVLRSLVYTKNGLVPASLVNALYPRAQLVDGDVRRVSASTSSPPAQRGVAIYSNEDMDFSAELPPALAYAEFTDSGGLGSFAWTGAFEDRTGISMVFRWTDGVDSTRYAGAYVSARRLSASGFTSNGTYDFPDASAMPGWEPRWGAPHDAYTWSVTVEGAASEIRFGARPQPGEVRWSSAIDGSVASSLRSANALAIRPANEPRWSSYFGVELE